MDISNGPTRLRIENGLLVIDTGVLNRVPVGQIQAVILSHPAITMTTGVLAVLSAENVPIIVCDNSYLPVGQVVPYEGASLSAERARLQIAASQSKMRLIWEKLISAKIKNQAFVLAEQGYSERADYLVKLCTSSNDVASLESHAARMYFEAIFESGFNRRDDGFAENRVLNYAYALLRSRVVRAICATGLHPTFGIKHHNKYNAFALADDLMEPWRPIYDMKALELISVGLVELEPSTKRELIEFAEFRLKIGRFERTVADWIQRTVRKCCLAIIDESESFSLEIPTLGS